MTEDAESETLKLKLHECPFCGESEDLCVGHGGDQGLCIAVTCMNCGVEGPDTGFVEYPGETHFALAALLWNGRARHQAEVEIEVDLNEYKH